MFDIVIIFPNITGLLFFYSNKCSLGEQKRHLSKHKHYRSQTYVHV